MVSTSALEVRNISFGYNAGLLLKDISFSVAAGELIALIGPNGFGQNHAAENLARPAGAELRRGETCTANPCRPINRKARAKTIAYVSQQPALSFPLTVRELVAPRTLSPRRARQ